jgi:hypothetical protein
MKTSIAHSNITRAKRTIAVAFCLTLTCVLAWHSPAQSCTAVPGPVAWWKGENNAKDSVSSHDGTLWGGAGFATGEVGQSFRFDGVDDYVEIPSDPEMEFTGPFTVEAWMKYTGSPNGGVIVTKGQDADWWGQDWTLYVTQSGKLGIIFAISHDFAGIECNTTISAGTWYHVAMVYDGAQLLGFVNGQLDGSLDISAGVLCPTQNPVRIGAGAPVNGTWNKGMFSGSIDEVSIYDRALSQSDLYSIYQAGVAGKCSPSCTPAPDGLVSWWKGAGNANDAVSGNTGSGINGVTYSAGKVGTGFEFNGVDNCITIPYSSSLISPTFTVETWVKPLSDVDDPIYQEAIFVQGYGLELCVRSSDTGMRVVFLVSDNSYQGYSQITSADAIPVGQFSHLAGTWDGTTLRLYINGVLEGEYETDGALSTSDCDFSIGGMYNACGFYTGQFFHGIVDELSFYNRALTPEEIQSIYGASGMGKCSEDADGDGLPDSWEMKYFGNLTQTADGDYDGDGISNLQEFQNGTDPNTISFEANYDSLFVNDPNLTGQITVEGGIPSYIAVLVNSSDFDSAVWQPYQSTFNVTLGPGDGSYTVRVGLRGLPQDAQKTWKQGTKIVLDRGAPTVTITTPATATSTTAKPYLQLQGNANEQLSKVRYDIANANGTLTDQDGSIVDQYWDETLRDFTTTYFQCYDVALANGLNTITVRATDLAGNTTTKNLSVTLDYSIATTPPTITMIWPLDGMQISGDTFYVRGTLNDETAQIAAQVSGGGTTTTVQGIVERNGVFWAEDLPLAAGNNAVTITATDAAGNSASRTITVTKSATDLVITSAPEDESLYQPTVTVSGTVSAGYNVTVNGVSATLDGGGNWTAQNVPVFGRGTATFDAVATPQAAGNPSVNTSVEREMPAFIALVEHHAFQTRIQSDPTGTPLVDYTWTKHFNAQYFNDNGQWVRKYSASVNENSWNAVYGTLICNFNWSSTDPIGTFSCDSQPGGAHTSGPISSLDAFTITQVTSIPDVDWHSDAPGGGWNWVHHFYASIVPPYHWVTGNGTMDVSLHAGPTRLKLYTGGKSGVDRRNLFRIQPIAFKYKEPPGVWGSPWLFTQATSVDPTEIKVLGKSPGNDGNLWIVLPDNTEQDLNLTVLSANHYSADAVQQKHRLFIQANSLNLQPNRVIPAAKFCVGQYLGFTTVFSPPLPEEPQIDSPQWNFDGNYVNQISPPIHNDGSPYYLENLELLKASTTHAWWTSGGFNPESTYKAIFGEGLTFNNGQHVVVTAKGFFSMHRPRVTGFTHTLDNDSLTLLQFLGEAVTPDSFDPSGHMDVSLKHQHNLGSPPSQGHDPDFLVNYLPAFSAGRVEVIAPFVGVVRTTQVVRGYVIQDSEVERDYQYPWLDNQEFYKNWSFPVTPGALSGWKNLFVFDDEPGIGCYGDYNNMHEDFSDFIRFKPEPNGEPGENIFVTLAWVDWHAHGSTTRATIPGTAIQDYVPFPQFNSDLITANDSDAAWEDLYDSDIFPSWEHTAQNTGHP